MITTLQGKVLYDIKSYSVQKGIVYWWKPPIIDVFFCGDFYGEVLSEEGKANCNQVPFMVIKIVRTSSILTAHLSVLL